jgi:putative Holliday junction resolvase
MDGRLLGVDYGRKRIGLALSEGLGATPLGFVAREHDQQAAQVVAALAAREGVAGIVVGLPLNADGSSGPAARWAKLFVEALARRTAIPIHRQDERHSSEEAEEQLRLAGKWPCDPGWLDAQAAAIVLRRYLLARPD